MKRFFQSPVRLRIGALLGTIAALCLAATASARPGGDGCKGDGRLEHRVRALDLDDETRTAVYAVLDKAHAARRTQEDELHVAREQLRELLAADAPEEATVLAQAERIGGLETALHQERLKTKLTIRDLVGSDAWGELQERRGRKEKRVSLR